MTTTTPTVAEIESEIAERESKINELRRERTDLALPALSDPKSESRLTKVRTEMQRERQAIEDLKLACAQLQELDRVEQGRLEELRRQEMESRFRTEVAGLVQLAEAVDGHLNAAAVAYRDLVTKAMDAGMLVGPAGLVGKKHSLSPITRMFHLRAALWNFFGEDIADASRVSNFRRAPLANLVRAIADGFKTKSEDAA